jgi:hypothetical protein
MARVSWLVSRLLARFVGAYDSHRNTLQKEVGADAACSFIST